VRDLTLRVNARIGARRADEVHRVSHDRRDRARQRLLDRGDAFAFRWRRALVQLVGELVLPAVISSTAVGDRDLVSLRSYFRLSARRIEMTCA
jgi:hypothetical protein